MIRLVDGSLGPFLWFLAGWSIRWAILIVALAIWFRVRPPRRAATRHLACLIALAAGLLLPVAPTWTAPRLWPISTRQSASANALDPPTPPQRISSTVDPEPFAPSTIPIPVEASRSIVAERPNQPTLSPIPVEPFGAWRLGILALAVAWLAGAVASLVHLAIGRALLARLRSSSRPLEGADLAGFERSRLEARIGRRVVEAAIHPAVGSPVAIGGRSAMILLPDDWPAWPEASQRACLLHELAHLRRLDDWWKLIAELIRAPFWFNPAVAWLTARLDREAELACDESTVTSGVAPRDLARLLLDFARRPHRLDPRAFQIDRQALSFFDQVTVSTRISRLLEEDMARPLIPPSKWKTIGLAGSVAILALAIGGARVRAIDPPQAPVRTATPIASQVLNATQTPVSTPGFSVVVKDEEGRPIEGATVVVATIDEDTGRQVSQTGPDGLARFDRKPKLKDQVVGYKPGYSFTGRNLRDEASLIATSLVLPRPRTVTGSVLDNGGRPIEGAEVRVAVARTNPDQVHFYRTFRPMVRGTAIEGGLMVRTDGEGRFRFDSLPDGANVTLIASADGKATTQAAPISLRSPTVASVEFVLAPEARVRGRVVTRLPGVAVSGRSVLLRMDLGQSMIQSGGEATTDAEGRFEIRGLAEGRANLALDKLPADNPWTFQPARNVRLTAGATASAEIELIEGVAVSGLVTSGDGKPLAGIGVSARVVVGPNLASPPLRTATDSAGRYRFRLFPGDATIYAQTEPGNWDTDLRRTVPIPEGRPTLEVDPFVVDNGVVLAGRIVDATGAPLGGAKLVVAAAVRSMVNGAPTKQPSAVADAEGRFSLKSQAVNGKPIPLDESVLFHVYLADSRKFDITAVPSRAGGETTIKLPTLLDGGPPGPDQVAPDEIAGLVVDSQGRPIEGGLADAKSRVPGDQPRTDSNGRFRVKGLGRPPLDFRLSKEGYAPVQFFDVPLGRAGWVVVLDDHTYFEGRVLAPDGSPVADAPIRADAGSKMLEGYERLSQFDGRSGPDGRYRFHLAPGMYEFQVRVPGVGVLRLPKQVIATDEVRSVDLRLIPPITFEARVVDAGDGSPIAGFTLKVFRSPGVEGTSGADGLLRIPDMLPGPFDDRSLRLAEYGRWWTDAPSLRSEKQPMRGLLSNGPILDFNVQAGMAPVTIYAERAATIRGRVVDPDGKPQAGATVSIGVTRSGDLVLGSGRFRATTDPTGAFTLKLLASGDDEYNLIAHDGPPRIDRTWADATSPFLKTGPGEVVDAGVIRLTRPATVEGRVVDAQGRPLANQEVQASREIGLSRRSIESTVRTGADGAFKVPFLEPGGHTIQVEPLGFYPTDAPSGAVEVVKLAEGESRTGIVLTGRPER